MVARSLTICKSIACSRGCDIFRKAIQYFTILLFLQIKGSFGKDNCVSAMIREEMSFLEVQDFIALKGIAIVIGERLQHAIFAIGNQPVNGSFQIRVRLYWSSDKFGTPLITPMEKLKKCPRVGYEEHAQKNDDCGSCAGNGELMIEQPEQTKGSDCADEQQKYNQDKW